MAWVGAGVQHEWCTRVVLRSQATGARQRDLYAAWRRLLSGLRDRRIYGVKLQSAALSPCWAAITVGGSPFSAMPVERCAMVNGSVCLVKRRTAA